MAASKECHVYLFMLNLSLPVLLYKKRLFKKNNDTLGSMYTMYTVNYTNLHIVLFDTVYYNTNLTICPEGDARRKSLNWKCEKLTSLVNSFVIHLSDMFCEQI